MLEVLHVFISFSKQFHKTYISILKVRITQQRKWGWVWGWGWRRGVGLDCVIIFVRIQNKRTEKDKQHN
jgi:hypothetical protein